MAKGIDIQKMSILSQEISGKETAFGRFLLEEEDEYIDFLMNAYRDQFNSAAFEDRETVRRLWRWEYADNPNAMKGGALIWLYRFKGRIIAQACLMPVRLKIEEKYFKAGWCQNVMILPEFRNMGLGAFLLKYMLEDLRKDEMDILMAAGTNDNSYALLKYMGFTDLGFIGRNLKPSFFASGMGTDSFADIKISEESDFGRDFDDFWNIVSQKYSCIVKRGADNLRWRFLNNPYSRYKILCARLGGVLKGYAVLRESRLKGRLSGIRIGVVSDILFDPEDKGVGAKLLSGAFSYLRDKTSLVRCDILSKDMQSVIRSAGFFNIKSNNRFLVHKVSDAARRIREDLFKDSASWHMAYGDSDLDIF